MLIAEGIAVVELPQGTRVEVLPDQLSFQEVGTTEQEMGNAVTYAATVNLDNGASLTWRVVEYPVGVFSEATVGGDAQLIRDFIFSFEHHEQATHEAREEDLPEHVDARGDLDDAPFPDSSTSDEETSQEGPGFGR